MSRPQLNEGVSEGFDSERPPACQWRGCEKVGRPFRADIPTPDRGGRLWRIWACDVHIQKLAPQAHFSRVRQPCAFSCCQSPSVGSRDVRLINALVRVAWCGEHKDAIEHAADVFKIRCDELGGASTTVKRMFQILDEGR